MKSKKNSEIEIPSQIMRIRNRAPKTIEELDAYLRFFYNVFLAKTPIEEGNSSPLDFVWDVFSTAMDYKNDNLYNFLGLATRGGMKCARKNTKVFSNSGCKNISELNNDIVSSYPKPSKASDLVHNGISDIYRLETHDGYYFEGTFNHRIAYFDNGIKYKILKDFTQDDYVLVGGNNLFNLSDDIDISAFSFEYFRKEHSKHYDSIKLPTKQDFDLGYLIGALVGDGCFTIKNSIDESTVVNRYAEIFKTKFNIDLKINQKDGFLKFSLVNRKIKEFFAFLGIDDNKSIDKTIPKIVWNGTKEFVTGFLSGLFDTDGSATFKNKKRRAINFTFANEQFTRDLQLLLLNFGIKCHLRSVKTNYKNSIAYHLKIEGVFAVKFANLIRSYSDKKSEKIRSIVLDQSDNVSGDYFPASIIRPLIDDIRLYYRKNFYRKNVSYVRNKIRSLDYKTITRRKIKNFLDVYSICKDCETYKTLESLINGNTFLDKVRKVEFLDVQDEVYDVSVPENENFFANGLLVHNSLSCAVIEMLLMQHDLYRDVFHMASITAQAYVTYDYFKGFHYLPVMKGVLLDDPTMRKSISHSGTKLIIGTATMDSVNSFHGTLVQDELDLTPALIFNESKGMLSAQRGKLPLNVCISSRKFGFGNVQKLLDESVKNIDFPFKVHKWGILEVTEKCLPSRHGEHGTTIFVNDDDLLAIEEDKFNSLPNSEKIKYAQKVGYENCIKCGIFSFCQGRLPNQEAENPFLQPIDIIKSQFKTEDVDFFKSQRLNRKPTTKGLIYYNWEETTHVKSYAQMYEIFIGEPHKDLIINPKTGLSNRSDITFEELVNVFIQHGGRFVIGVDFGFSIRAVAGLYFIDGSERIYFIDELSVTGQTDGELADEMKRRWQHIPIEMVYADPESPGGKKEIRMRTGWITSEKVDKNVKEGIATVRKKLRIPGTKDTMLFVSTKCVVFLYEVVNYRNKINPTTKEPLEEVHKDNDHSCDQLRYVIHTMFGNRADQFNFDQRVKVESSFDPRNALRAPKPTELGQMLGFSVSDNKPNPNDSITKNSNSFSWSFS